MTIPQKEATNSMEKKIEGNLSSSAQQQQTTTENELSYMIQSISPLSSSFFSSCAFPFS
jgi:hypothetical protein